MQNKKTGGFRSRDGVRIRGSIGLGMGLGLVMSVLFFLKNTPPPPKKKERKEKRWKNHLDGKKLNSKIIKLTDNKI